MIAHWQSVGLWPDERGQSEEAEVPPRVLLDCSNGKRQICIILKSGHDSGFVIPFSREETITDIFCKDTLLCEFSTQEPASIASCSPLGKGQCSGETLGTSPPQVSLAVMGAFENLPVTALGFSRGEERLERGCHTSPSLASFLVVRQLWVLMYE